MLESSSGAVGYCIFTGSLHKQSSLKFSRRCNGNVRKRKWRRINGRLDVGGSEPSLVTARVFGFALIPPPEPICPIISRDLCRPRVIVGPWFLEGRRVGELDTLGTVTGYLQSQRGVGQMAGPVLGTRRRRPELKHVV